MDVYTLGFVVCTFLLTLFCWILHFYFTLSFNSFRLKKRKSTKQNPELASSNSHVDAPPSKDSSLKVILGHVPEKALSLDEEKKKKRGQGKQLRRSENKRHSTGMETHCDTSVYF